MNITLAFSPCPNDTFVFHALLHGIIDTGGYTFTPHIADVEELNRLAFAGTHDVTKLSFAAWLALKDRYTLLDAGAALGFGCGPLLVAGKPLSSLEDARIAVPGQYTTAFLLLRLWNPNLRHIESTRFDAILPGIAAGRYDAGLIIHEGRFVYPQYHCTPIIDLGQWWETQTGLPIPLGCIAVRGDLRHAKTALEDLIRASIRAARANPDAARDFIKRHAQELDDTVIQEHIALYVNDYTLNLGDEGQRAIATLQDAARRQGVL